MSVEVPTSAEFDELGQEVVQLTADVDIWETDLTALTTRVTQLEEAAPVAGPPGPPGTPGINGVDGTNGVDGINGVNGIDGINGVNGTNGAPGIAGPAGPPGAPGTGTDPSVIRVNGFNDAAVAAAFAQLTYQGNCPDQEIYFPAGTYNLSQSIFTTPDGNTRTLEGLTIRGAGKRRTKVNFSGGPNVPVIRAIKALRFFKLEGFSFYSTDITQTFCYAFSNVAGGGYNQRWTLQDIEWNGSWKNVFALDGPADANLNSEMSFIRCETSTSSKFGSAFFEVGAIDGVADNQENQFLNYFFYDCNFTLASGTVFLINKGGCIHIQNGSWSAASSTSGDILWFSMPLTNYNNRSADVLSVRGVRFEPKGANQRILDCGWNTGVVSFTDCVDLSSVQNDASKAYSFYRVTGGSPWGKGEMPIVMFTRHQGAGFHTYDGPPVTGGGGFIYEGCYFFRGVSGQRALPTLTQGADNVLRWSTATGKGAPKFSFQNNANVDSVGGF